MMDEQETDKMSITNVLIQMNSFHKSSFADHHVPTVWLNNYQTPFAIIKIARDYAVVSLTHSIPDRLLQRGVVKLARLPQRNTKLIDQLIIAGYGKGNLVFVKDYEK